MDRVSRISGPQQLYSCPRTCWSLCWLLCRRTLLDGWFRATCNSVFWGVTSFKPSERYRYNWSLAGKLNNAGGKSCWGGIPQLCVRFLTPTLTTGSFSITRDMQVVYVCTWPTLSLCHHLTALPELAPPAQVWLGCAPTIPLITLCFYVESRRYFSWLLDLKCSSYSWEMHPCIWTAALVMWSCSTLRRVLLVVRWCWAGWPVRCLFSVSLGSEWWQFTYVFWDSVMVSMLMA